MGQDQRARTTRAERDEVVRLRAEGVSVRQIAAEVFGDGDRFRGRVERILKTPAGTGLVGEGDGVGLDGLTWTEAITLLYERRLAVLVAEGVPPSMSELRNLLDVQRRLEASALFEQANELTRGSKRSG